MSLCVSVQLFPLLTRAGVAVRFLVLPAFPCSPTRYQCDDALPDADWDVNLGSTESRPAGMRGAQVSATRHSTAELEAAQHQHELPEPVGGGVVHLHVDTAHPGVAGLGDRCRHVWWSYPQYVELQLLAFDECANAIAANTAAAAAAAAAATAAAGLYVAVGRFRLTIIVHKPCMLPLLRGCQSYPNG